MTSKDLFNDSDGEDGADTLKVNENFAEKFEATKRKEELTNLKAKKFEEDDESYSSEDSDAELLTGDLDVEIMRTVALLKAKDPTVYDPKSKFYSKEDHYIRPKDKKKKDKPQYLKDVVAKQLLENGPELDSDSDDDGSGRGKRAPSPSNVEKEEMLRKEVIKAAANDNDSDDDMFTLRNKSKAEEEAEEDEYKDWAEQERKRLEQLPVAEQEALKRYYQEDNLDDKEQFLREYILNQKWMEKDKNHVPTYAEIVDESEEDLDRVDNFERTYNFRFEEPGANVITGHARVVEGSMRKKKETRKEARKRKKERQEAEKKERAEELKRLKNLKKQEALEKLKAITEAAGTGAEHLPFTADDLDEDFDPDKWSQQMNALFDDKYYDEEDDEKPVFSDSDEAVARMTAEASDSSSSSSSSSTGGKKKKKKKDKKKDKKKKEKKETSNAAPGDYVESSDEDEIEDEQAQSLRKSANTFRGRGKKLLAGQVDVEKTKEEIRKKIEEYYELDHEDLIGGDLPTRFHYVKVPAMDFGLDPEEVLALDDKELTSHVSLKKLAPYHDQEEIQKWWKKEAKKRRYAPKEAGLPEYGQQYNDNNNNGRGSKAWKKREKEQQKKKEKKGKKDKKDKKDKKRKDKEKNENDSDASASDDDDSKKEKKKKKDKKKKKEKEEEEEEVSGVGAPDVDMSGLSKKERRRLKRERDNQSEDKKSKKESDDKAEAKRRRLAAFSHNR